MPDQRHEQRIAIAGAGVSGAYLYRLLRNQGFEADIFDIGCGTRCGLSPCAWGTSRGFRGLVEAAGLNADNYFLKRLDYVLMDEFKIEAELMTFDKISLINDLLEGATINNSAPDVTAYDRVVDATGVSRAFLPAIDDDVVMECIQYRIKSAQALENRIRLGRIGYAWCFPLADKGYHIGCGSLVSDADARLKNLDWPQRNASEDRKKPVCVCRGKVRLTGPQFSQPFVSDRIWGVGEAIGCVAPLAGDGVVPSMRSVQHLISHWNDSTRYTQAILREFKWMKSERRVIDKLRRKGPPGILDARVLQRNAKRMDMRIKIRDAVKLCKRLQ